MATIRRIGPEDWREWREVRLAALKDAPDAFGSTYEREIAFGEADWRTRLTRGGPIVAELDGRIVGCAAGVPDADDPSTVEVYAMWVAASARGGGAAGALIESIVSDAREAGAKRVHLWVTETNERARAFYRRHGFTETGEREPLLSNTTLDVLGMERVP